MKTPQPLVSVLLNCFNSERYIAEQISSILEQTHANLELVIVDNQSTDGTRLIVESFARKDARVKWFQNDENVGLIKSFEKGLQLCQGEYIAPSDSDDVWMPEKIERQLNYLIAHPEADMVFTDSLVVDSNLAIISPSFQKILKHPHKKPVTLALLLRRNLVPVHVALFHHRIIKSATPIPTGFMHDQWLALVCSLRNPLGYIDQPTMYYRQHQNNMIGAGVNSPLFFFLKYQKVDFVRQLIESQGNHLHGFERLLEIAQTPTSKKTLRWKIACFKTLNQAWNEPRFIQFIWRLAVAGWFALRSRQIYHLGYCVFFIFSWPVIKKLNHAIKST